MNSYTSPPANNGQSDAEPTVITGADFNALLDVEPGTIKARKLLGTMGLRGGGIERVVIVDSESGSIIKEGGINTTDADLGTFARTHDQNPDGIEPADSEQVLETELDANENTFADTLERAGLGSLLDRAGSALEASGNNDATFTRSLDVKLNSELVTLRARLTRADSEGPWQGNKLQNHQQLKRQIEDFVNQAMSTVPSAESKSQLEAERQVKQLKPELDNACESLASVAQQDERIRPVISQLQEIAHSFGAMAGVNLDTSTLRRNLQILGNSIYDTQMTISDVISIVSRISIATEECTVKGRGASMRKMQLATELRAFRKRLQSQ